MVFYPLQKALQKDKYGKKIMNAATKTGTDTAKTASKRVAHKTP